MKTKVDALWMATVIADSDDDTQSEFLNELGRCLVLLCREKASNQICFIADKLNGNGQRLFEEMMSFINIKEKQK